MFRGPLCCLGSQRFTVARHQHRDFMRRLLKMQQGSVNLLLQHGKLWEVLQMRRFLFDLLPQVLDWIEVR